jgi:tetratricopeptide (TPR) repeat protein
MEFAPRYHQKKINVFVSSTFRDMIAERDELTLRIFPALRKVCEERGIAWGEVDLRWGIPEEKKGEVLSTCLKFIDECRPYFIGMLGERYGWVEEAVPEGVIKDYPWIKDHKGKSITELEILHGVLRNPEMATHAFFYFRDKVYLESGKFRAAVKEEDLEGFFETNEEAHQKLSDLKERIRKSGFPVRENYPDPRTFGELVNEDLMRVIDAITPPPKPLSDAERDSATLDREEMAHEAFAASRFGVYIPRQEYYDRLNYHANGDGRPLVVLGELGSGKSALLAHWAFRYKNNHPDKFVLVHFIGASPESGDWKSMLRRFMGEFKRKFSIPERIPGKEEDLIAAFRNWLSMAAARSRIVLIIDALDQLEDRDGAPDLVWLQYTIPANVRLIVSTREGRPLDAVQKREWFALIVEPLSVSERKDLIACYLRKYHKELSPRLKDELALASQSNNPHFLRALLEEVRIHGTFETIADQIKDYLTASTIDALYEMILARYERDYERDRPGLVKDTVSILWAARRGLSKPELMDLLGSKGKPIPDAYWAPLYLAMEQSLIEKDGQITFFNSQIRTAIAHRYLLSEERKKIVHQHIADYFALRPNSLRKTEELPWQLAKSTEWDRLVALLIDPSFFLEVWQLCESDVRKYWVEIEAGSSYRIINAYRPVIKDPASFPRRFVELLNILLYGRGHWAEASALSENLIQSYTKLGGEDKLAYANTLINKANILEDQGDLEGAMKLYKETERICREIGNIAGLPATIGNQALILFTRGDLDGAMALHKEEERICRVSGDLDSLGRSLGNQARILRIRGDLEGSMALCKQEESICRVTGDIDSLQKSLSHQALILRTRCDLEGSMALLKETERICREIGKVESLQECLGTQATICHMRGDMERAMTLYQEQERICREIGAVVSLQHSLTNQALILRERGDLERAMALLKETEQAYRNIGDVNSLQIVLGNRGLILEERGDLDGAMILFREQERISRGTGNSESIGASLGYQASILAKKGDLDGAMALHKETERICRELGAVNGLMISLFNQAIILWNQKRENDAAVALEEAYMLASNTGDTPIAKKIRGLYRKFGGENF